jgi:NAD(P)-dependent dehydrogenase (short-subunit alcohol dehydrogenase family)
VDLAGKTVVVTGAASGIGFAIADACARQGARIVLGDVEVDALDRARAAIADRGVEVVAVRTDVRERENLDRLRDATDDAFGGADVLCNNAGVSNPFAPIWEAERSDLEWVFKVNMGGVLHGLRAFLPGMIERGRPGHVVNTASMSALGPAAFSASYAMTKAAVVSLSCSLRDELQAVGAPIGVSVVLPELIATRLAFSTRNRGASTDAVAEDPEQDWSRDGISPTVIADRVTSAIRDERLWAMPPASDQFVQAALAWMDDIRAATS